jgi:uncharacterized protein (DUF302 family)
MIVKKTLAVFLMAISTVAFSKSSTLNFEDHGFAIEQTVYKVPVDEGVTAEEVHDSIMNKGAELNMKFVGHQPLSKELDARGVVGGQVDIYQFCNPMDARKMIDFNPIFVAYMPCRIALVEDKDNRLWLMMVNLDMLINNTSLTPDIKEMANGISNKLKTLIDFAREGEF